METIGRQMPNPTANPADPFGKALAITICLAQPSAASEPLPIPATDCAAFWLGYGDYATLSAYLDEEAAAEAYRNALAWRRAAIGESGDAAATDAQIVEMRQAMTLLAEAYIYDGDNQSRELFERMVAHCDPAGLNQPGQ